MRKTLEQKLLSKIISYDGCWQWRSKNSANYPQLRHEGKCLNAHRVSYRIFKGVITGGKFVLHKCNNRLCVNPDHLYLGTDYDNAQDRKKTGWYLTKPCKYNNIKA